MGKERRFRISVSCLVSPLPSPVSRLEVVSELDIVLAADRQVAKRDGHG